MAALRFFFLVLLTGAITSPAQDLRPDDTAKPSLPPPPPARARVVLSEKPALLQRFQPDNAGIRSTVNRLILAHARQRTLADAWRTLVSPQDTVGIKISTAGGPILGTHRAILEAVLDGLLEAGVPPRQIIVWDKHEDQMVNAGYVPMQPPASWQCLAVIPGAGFDGGTYYFHEIAGQLIWGDRDFVGRPERKDEVIQRLLESATREPRAPAPDPKKNPPPPSTPPQVSNRSYFTRIVTRDITKLINIPVLSDHDRIGVWGAVASLALGSVDNHRRFLADNEAAGLGIAEILAHETLRSKTVLHIMDGLVGQYAGGPTFQANYAGSPGLIMISNDPVALDTLALERIEDGRRTRSVVPVGDKAHHLRQAAALGLGKADRSKIDLVVVP
jgi:hypothetical protein